MVRNATLTAIFDRDMNAGTLDSPATGFVAAVEGSAVAASVVYDAPSRTATLSPSAEFPARRSSRCASRPR